MTRPIQPDGNVHGAVVGCPRADGRWLLIRRGPHVAAPYTICFPGGGIEIGELPEAAAVRELREELGARVRLVRKVWHWHAPDRPLVLHGYLGELLSDTLHPQPEEVAEALWLTPTEVFTHRDRLLGTEDFMLKLQTVRDEREVVCSQCL